MSLASWENPARVELANASQTRDQGRGVRYRWAAARGSPGRVQYMCYCSFVLRLPSASRKKAALAVVTEVDALRMCCHTACFREANIAARLWLHYWPAIAPRTATWTRIPRRRPRRSTVFRRSKHSRHRHFYFRARVLPCRRHQCMHPPCHERTPAGLAVARSQRRDAGMARKCAPWERKDSRILPTAKFPSFPTHRRWVLLRRGSPPLLHAI